MVKFSVVQLTSTPDVATNLAEIERQLTSICIAKKHFVLLPECCLFFGGRDAEQLKLAKDTYHSNELRKQLAAMANRFSICLIAGSIPLYQQTVDKFTNSCCVFSPQGEELSCYDKIHLFDVNVDDGEKSYRESRFTQAGKEITVVDLDEITLGLSICYDVRFPELYRQLTQMGANIITVPSAFTKVTGQAHWQTLLQARAIENQVYIIAAGQEGKHQNGRETWGHSMIISPWGEILECLEQGQGIITAELSMKELSKVRKAMPVAAHNQFITKLKSYE